METAHTASAGNQMAPKKYTPFQIALSALWLFFLIGVLGPPIIIIGGLLLTGLVDWITTIRVW